MTTQAVQTQEKLAAADLAGQVLAHPKNAGKLALNFAVEQLRAGKEELSIEQLSDLQDLVAQYSKGPGETASQKTAVKPSDLCNLQVSKTALGTEVTFTIPKGMSGKEVVELIEKANPRQPGDGVVYPQSNLLTDEGLNTKVAEDTKYTFTVCEKSYNRTRREQEAYLADNSLTAVPRFVVTVGAALYRDREGFPEDRGSIGTNKDNGDLFKSKWVRARSGGVMSDGDGLDADYALDGSAGDRVVVAGAPLPNQKS